MCLAYGSITILSIFFAYCIFRVCRCYSINPFSLDLGKTKTPIYLTYPSASDEHGIEISVKFDIESDKMITEGSRLILTNIEGYLFSRIVRMGNSIPNPDIDRVEVGFKESQPSYINIIALEDNVPGQWINRRYKRLSATLDRKGRKDPTGVELFDTWLNDEFYFPIAGDYFPAMFIVHRSGFIEECIEKGQKIHVMPKSETYTQALNQINSLIAIILLIFGYLQTLKIIYDLNLK